MVRLVVVGCLLACATVTLRAQSSSEEEWKGGYAEGRWYFDSTGVGAYAVAYFQSYLFVDGDEKVGVFAWARANSAFSPHSALVAGLSYAPSQFIGTELGGGIDGNPLEEFWYLRGRLWLGRDMMKLGIRDLYYFDSAVEVAERGIVNWEVRLKIRVTHWLGCGVYGESTKGAGPRFDIQPRAIPLSVSVTALIARWDTKRYLRTQDVMAGIFARWTL